jgi:hypothetical protein
MVGKTQRVDGFGTGFLAQFGIVALGLFTPLLLLALLLFVAGWTWIFAIVICPLLGHFVTLQVCRGVFESLGRPAFKRYTVSALLGFALWGAALLVASHFIVHAADGAGGMFVVILLVVGLVYGCAFLSWAIAARRCWSLASDKDDPSSP